MYPDKSSMARLRKTLSMEYSRSPMSDTMARTRRRSRPISARSDREVRRTEATEGSILDQRHSVLVVDDSEETREVLQTALSRRGMQILSTSRAADALELARQHHPDLIVLDLELDKSEGRKLAGPLAEQSRADRAPLVMLGSVRRGGQRLPQGEFVAKPYHYGPLIRRIEELLEKARPERSIVGRTIREPLSCRRCSSSAGSTKAHVSN